MRTKMRTLGEYRDFCAALDGEDSPAVKFFDSKIGKQRRNEPVLIDENQMLQLIRSLIRTDVLIRRVE